MNLRIARKILVSGRPLLPANDTHGSRMCAQESTAREVVLQHWGRRAWPDGEFNDECDAWCHADNRAIQAQERRIWRVT